jgi:hypothetical protein
MMVFIETLKKWRHYLLNRLIIVQTDLKFDNGKQTSKMVEDIL